MASARLDSVLGRTMSSGRRNAHARARAASLFWRLSATKASFVVSTLLGSAPRHHPSYLALSSPGERRARADEEEGPGRVGGAAARGDRVLRVGGRVARQVRRRRDPARHRLLQSAAPRGRHARARVRRRAGPRDAARARPARGRAPHVHRGGLGEAGRGHDVRRELPARRPDARHGRGAVRLARGQAAHLGGGRGRRRWKRADERRERGRRHPGGGAPGLSGDSDAARVGTAHVDRPGVGQGGADRAAPRLHHGLARL